MINSATDGRQDRSLRLRPTGGAGFEFGPGRFSTAEADEFSDFFSSLFGNFARQADAHRARGEDRHAKIVIPLEDAFYGATRAIALRAPQLDAQGRVLLREHTLNVRIPKGIRDGQLIRLAGQGAPGSGGAPGGDLYLEVPTPMRCTVWRAMIFR